MGSEKRGFWIVEQGNPVSWQCPEVQARPQDNMGIVGPRQVGLYGPCKQISNKLFTETEERAGLGRDTVQIENRSILAGHFIF